MELIRDDSDMPGAIACKLGGVGKPEYSNDAKLAKALADILSFEDYRLLVCKYLPDIKQLGIKDIQSFRNAVHPWKAVQAPGIYGDFDEARAISHLTSLVLLTKHLLSWTPTRDW